MIVANPADSSQAKLSSAAVGPGTIKVVLKVTDSLATQSRKTLIMQARDTCYFAYTALEGTDSRLRLLDPLAESPAPVALDNNQGVYDFQFSPDGQFLAYRHDADLAHPTGQHISLVTLSSLQQRELSFQESAISAFSWSPDSSLLAVAFVSNDVTYLGGVRASISNAPPVALVATVAPVQSDLYWVGNNAVAFHAELIPDFAHPGQFFPDPVFKRRTTFFALLGAHGFDAPKGIIQATYSPGIHLQPSSNGIFVITDQGPGFVFNQLSASTVSAVDHPDANLVSPSGRYSASNSEDAHLQVFSAEDGTLSPPVSTSKEGEDCPMLLAWAKGMERIACVADVPNSPLSTKHGEIRIFDLSSSSETLEMSTLGDFCTEDTNSPVGMGDCGSFQKKYNYGTTRAAGNARAFSALGRRLAFTTTSEIQGESHLYLVDLHKGFKLDRKIYLATIGQLPSPTSSTDLAFSPDESFLLLRRGNVLTEYDLTDLSEPPPPPTILSQKLTASPRCPENFSTEPDQWCGNTDRVAALRWSMDSRALAFRTPGKLNVVDNTQFPATETFPLDAPDCEQKCTGQFAFQPLPPP